MRDTADDIATILAAAGLGLTKATNLFIGSMPAVEDPSAPDLAVAVLQTGGGAPIPFMGQGQKAQLTVTCQVRVRGDREQFVAGQSLAFAAMRALNQTSPAPYTSIKVRESAPFHLGPDQSDRPLWTFNLECTYIDDASTPPSVVLDPAATVEASQVTVSAIAGMVADDVQEALEEIEAQLIPATDAAQGFVSTLAQAWAGVKTFIAGLTLRLATEVTGAGQYVHSPAITLVGKYWDGTASADWPITIEHESALYGSVVLKASGTEFARFKEDGETTVPTLISNEVRTDSVIPRFGSTVPIGAAVAVSGVSSGSDAITIPTGTRVNAGDVGFGRYVYNTVNGFFSDPATAEVGVMNANGSARLVLNVGNGTARATGHFTAARLYAPLTFTDTIYPQTSQAPVTARGTAADTSTAVGVVVGSDAAWATAGAKLLSVRNGGTERVNVDLFGTTTIDLAGRTNTHAFRGVNLGGGSGSGLVLGYSGARSVSLGGADSGRMSLYAANTGIDITSSSGSYIAYQGTPANATAGFSVHRFQSGPALTATDGKIASFYDDAGTTQRASIHTDGTVEVHTAGAGIILKSPSGTRYKITVTDAGALTTTAV